MTYHNLSEKELPLILVELNLTFNKSILANTSWSETAEVRNEIRKIIQFIDFKAGKS